MAFEHRFTGEGLVVEVTPTGGSLITITDDYTSFSWSISDENVDVTAGNEQDKSKLPTKTDMTWSLDVWGGDDDTWEDFLVSRTGVMTIYRHGIGSGSEYFSFNYIREGFETTTGTDAAEEISISGSRSGAMLVDFNSVQGTLRHLEFVTQPTNTSSGEKIASVVVRVEDASDAVIATEQSDVITISIGAGDTVLSGVLSVRVINGVASFPGIVVTGVDTGNTLIATSAKGYTQDTSGSFDVS